MVELYNYLVCLGGSCVNFHELSVDPVKVKFGECYSYVSKNPKNYEICCLILFNRVSQLCQNQPLCLLFLV
jgi:hypothetical protein